jgi:hypothetical protein
VNSQPRDVPLTDEVRGNRAFGYGGVMRVTGGRVTCAGGSGRRVKPPRIAASTGQRHFSGRNAGCPPSSRSAFASPEGRQFPQFRLRGRRAGSPEKREGRAIREIGRICADFLHRGASPSPKPASRDRRQALALLSRGAPWVGASPSKERLPSGVECNCLTADGERSMRDGRSCQFDRWLCSVLVMRDLLRSE